MKANELVKKSINIKDVYERINQSNNAGDCKLMFPHFQYIEESVKLELMKNGFKCYIGEWDGYTTNAFIIEW